MVYFVITSLKEVVDDAFKVDSNIIYFGNNLLVHKDIFIGIFCFLVATPLTFVRRIEKFSFTYLIADLLILITAIAIIVYSCLYVRDHGWGKNVPLFNTETWLTMIGSAIYSYEGIGVVIPLLEVTANP